jgi:hypothetical protein
MKITSKNRSKKPIIIASVVIALSLLSALAYVYAFNGDILGWNSGKENQSAPTSNQSDKPTNEQVEAGEGTKPGGSDSTPAPTPQPGSNKNSINMSFTAANQNGSILQLRVLISSVVNTGECTLTMTKDGVTVSRTASVQALASSSTCKGFDIPVSDLSTGTWQAVINYENDTLTGTTSKAIAIQQ